MHKLARPVVGAVALAAMLVGGPTIQAAAPSVPTADRYIVVLKNSISNSRLTTQALTQSLGLKPTHTYEYALKGFAALIPPNRLAALRADPRVQSIMADGVVHTSAQVAPTGIQRAGASTDGVHQTLSVKGTGIGVAVLDTGVARSHPDLQATISPLQTTCVGTLTAEDDNGHGTHVSGTIAAIDNNEGVVGMAPQAIIFPVKVLDSTGDGTFASVMCGIDWVTANAKNPDGSQRIHVANMSLTGGGSSDNNCGLTDGDAMHQAICRSTGAGVTYVVAAGNQGSDAGFSVPAAYDDTVITVSALADSDGRQGGLGPATASGADDRFASFSNFGRPVAIGAPGVNILSTTLTGYGTASGTSMASPHVAGAAALYIQRNPGALWTDVLAGLLAIAETDLDTCSPSGLPANACHTDPSGLHPEPVLRVSGI